MKTKLDLKKLIENEKFHYVNSDITTANFPLPKAVEIPTKDNCKLIYLSKTTTSEETLEMIKKEGYRPANIYELMLWFSKNKSSIKPYQWIVAFGQTWKDADGHHRVPYVLAHTHGDFEFSLGYFESVWCDYHALLCFCDKSLESQTLRNTDSLTLRPFEQEDINEAIKFVKKSGYEVFKKM